VAGPLSRPRPAGRLILGFSPDWIRFAGPTLGTVGALSLTFLAIKQKFVLLDGKFYVLTSSFCCW
ncbi:MAG TPA: hypothetical protein VGD43_19690, partial [Micromonospora sp.]